MLTSQHLPPSLPKTPSAARSPGAPLLDPRTAHSLAGKADLLSGSAAFPEILEASLPKGIPATEAGQSAHIPDRPLVKEKPSDHAPGRDIAAAFRPDLPTLPNGKVLPPAGKSLPDHVPDHVLDKAVLERFDIRPPKSILPVLPDNGAAPAKVSQPKAETNSEVLLHEAPLTKSGLLLDPLLEPSVSPIPEPRPAPEAESQPAISVLHFSKAVTFNAPGETEEAKPEPPRSEQTPPTAATTRPDPSVPPTTKKVTQTPITAPADLLADEPDNVIASPTTKNNSYKAPATSNEAVEYAAALRPEA